MSGLQLDQLQSCSSPIFVEEELTAGGTVHPVGVLAGSKPGIKRKATGSGSATAKKARPDVDEIIQNVSTRTTRGSMHSRDDHIPTQCLGPGCIYEARPHSDYCSEECGIQLAIKRIKTYLPAKKKLAGNEVPIATIKNREKLKELDGEQKAIKDRLDRLDEQTLSIDNHMEKISKCTPSSEEEVFDAESDILTIYCPSCGQPITLKKSRVHMERCYNKVESMVSFGSFIKSEGTDIFCDKYDPVQKTYCKRLKVLCPEHTKEPKIGEKEVCGYPLDPLFPSVNKDSLEFCRRQKKICMDHYCWEKLRRAEIDQEKLNLYLKLEEVGEQIRLNQWQIDQRGSLLAMMLNHTIDHSKESTGEASTSNQK